MTIVYVVLAAVFAAGVVLALYAWLAPREQNVAPPPAPAQPQSSPARTEWTAQAGEEFAGLSESARCDLIFAVAELDDERSHQLLVHAMDDPSDAVATAAAHALAQRGSFGVVSDYAQRHPGERADRIVQTISLLQ